MRDGTTLRGRRKSSLLARGDTFHILDREGTERAKARGAAAHALVAAHRAAETSPDEITLTIERRSVLGPKVTIYKVTRDERGTVYTNVVSQDD